MAGIGKVMGKKFFRDWKDLNDNWGKAVERNMGRKVEMDRASKQVDVERLKRNVRVGGWQPEPEGCGFSSIMKQKKKAKNCAVFCFAGKRKIFFIYL